MPSLEMQNDALPLRNDGWFVVNMSVETIEPLIIVPSGLTRVSSENARPGFVEIMSPFTCKLSQIRSKFNTASH